MCPCFFHCLPQLLDRIVIRRIARQLEDRSPLRVCGKEVLHGSRCVILGSIRNQHDRLRGLSQPICEKGDISIRVEPSRLALISETPGEVLHQADDLVALALARRRDHWLVATSCPGI